MLVRNVVGIIFTPKGTPGQATPPVKVKTIVGSMFPQSQTPADLSECLFNARLMQMAVQSTLDRVQENTGAFGAYGTFLDRVTAEDE